MAAAPRSSTSELGTIGTGQPDAKGIRGGHACTAPCGFLVRLRPSKGEQDAFVADGEVAEIEGGDLGPAKRLSEADKEHCSITHPLCGVW